MAITRLTEEERKERRKIASNKYSRKMRLDPEYNARFCVKAKDYYYRMKEIDPTFLEKIKARNRKSYHDNIKPYKEKMEQRKLKAREKVESRRILRKELKFKLQQLLGGRCTKCGIEDSRLLDFDHIDPSKKTMMISQSLHKPEEQILEELKNCQLLCPNCHRIKTLESKDYDAYKNREFRNSYRTPFKPLNPNS